VILSTVADALTPISRFDESLWGDISFASINYAIICSLIEFQPELDSFIGGYVDVIAIWFLISF
jgi:hypothetical protein